RTPVRSPPQASVRPPVRPPRRPPPSAPPPCLPLRPAPQEPPPPPGLLPPPPAPLRHRPLPPAIHLRRRPRAPRQPPRPARSTVRQPFLRQPSRRPGAAAAPRRADCRTSVADATPRAGGGNGRSDAPAVPVAPPAHRRSRRRHAVA